MSVALAIKCGIGPRRLILVAVALLAALLVFRENFGRPLGGPLQRLGSLLEKTAIGDLGACLCRPSHDLTLVRDDGLRLAASLYTERSREQRPAIVLMHGNTYKGRQLPLYTVLASGLAERGYDVLTVDRAGFGESEDPFKTAEPGNAPDPGADVSAALAHLTGSGSVTPDRIHLIGHSGGVPPILSAGLGDARVQKLVAIGPPRRMAERLADPMDRQMFWDRARRYREILGLGPFPDWYTQDRWRRHKLGYSDLGNYKAPLADPGHKPVLFIDGAREPPADRRYLEAFIRETADPKRYVTVPNADHYSNTTDVGAVTAYDRRVLSYTLEVIDRFLRN